MEDMIEQLDFRNLEIGRGSSLTMPRRRPSKRRRRRRVFLRTSSSPPFLLVLLSIPLLYNGSWYSAHASSTVSSVWAQQSESNNNPQDKKERHPLQWLQQHLPNLFGGATKHPQKHKTLPKQKAQTQASLVQTDIKGLSRRRLLYQYAWQQHKATQPPPPPAHTNHTWFDYYAHAPPTSDTFPPFPPSLRTAMLQEIRAMFAHAYDGYYWNAWPDGELLPLSCRGTNFSLIQLPALTAVDTLDTLWIMGNTTELVRMVERLRQLHHARGTSLWNVNQNVSLFETTIRVLGGLLSAHQMLVLLQDDASSPTEPLWHHDIWDPVTGQVLDGRSDLHHVRHPQHHYYYEDQCPVPPPLICAGIARADCWTGTPTASSCEAVNATRRRRATTAPYQYDGVLLEWAVDLGHRLLPAFATATGIPYGTVHLQDGVPPGETPVASLAGAGTLVLEWELLSRLSGNPVYGQVARLAARALWQRQSAHHLVGKHIDSRSGNWVESLSGIGSNSDSFIEYLVKYSFVFGDQDHRDFGSMWRSIYEGVYQHMRKGDWWVDTDYQTPSHSRHTFESLMAFFPGLQVWLGEWAPAARSLSAFFTVREYLGFLPERFSLSSWKADGPTYPLRPELLESNYLMHRAVQNFALSSPFTNHSAGTSGWLWAAAWSVDKLSQLKTACGFATLAKVDPSTTGQIGGESTTWKPVDDMPSFFLSETLKYLYLTFDEDNPLHRDDNRQWMFTTEAHPIHVPARHTSRDDLLRLEQILLQRRKGKKAARPARHLEAEQWSEKTTQKEFLNQLWPTELKIKRQGLDSGRKGAFFFRDRELLFEVDDSIEILDDWNELASRQNLAHLKFSATGVGSGLSLRSACPNFDSSELIWIHALNGDALDFTSDFVPVDNEQKQQKSSRKAVVYGSVEALDHLHMQYTSARLRESTGCLIEDLGIDQAGSDEELSKMDDGTVKFESDIGVFHVTPSADGTGFAVERKDDGYTVNVSFLHSLDGSQQIFDSVVVHSEGGSKNDSPRGQVGVADFDGNSFICEVSLLKIPRDAGGSMGESAEEEEILRVPCTPAFFGPAHITNLVQSKGWTTRAPLYLPPASDHVGCKALSHFSEVSPDVTAFENTATCDNTNIQVVIRGVCSFMTKAVNQKVSRNADAIIVMNTEDELFTMAGDPEMDSLDPHQTPLAVMIGKSHGQQLSAILQASADAEHQVIGKVALLPQPRAEALEGRSDTSSLRFPLVYATPSMVQIYAKGHWGIQATASGGNWNLQLVVHRLG